MKSFKVKSPVEVEGVSERRKLVEGNAEPGNGGERRAAVMPERLCLMLVLVLIVAYTLTPFEFSTSPADLMRRTKEALALSAPISPLKLLGHCLGFGMLGMLMAMVFRRTIDRCQIGWIAFFAVTFCILLEVCQVLALLRHPRIVDLLCNAFALTIGMLGMRKGGVFAGLHSGVIGCLDRHVFQLQTVLLTCGLGAWCLASLYPAWALKMNWNGDFQLAVGNETDGSRPWLGELSSVDIYGTSLAAEEIHRMHEEGAGASTPQRLLGYDFTENGKQVLTPSGSLKDAALFLLIPPECVLDASKGAILDSPSLIISRGAAEGLTREILNSGAFTVAFSARPLKSEETGPARIVSLSDGIWERNFTLAQQRSNLVFRVRNGANGLNGMNYSLWARNAFDALNHDYVAVYDHGVSKLFRDGLKIAPVVDLREPLAYLRLGTNSFGTATGALLLSLTVALPMGSMLLSSRLARWRHPAAMIITFLLGSTPYLMVCLEVGGPLRLSLFCWLAGVLAVIYPLCQLFVCAGTAKS